MTKPFILGALFASLLTASACTTAPTDPKLQDVGPPPVNASKTIKAHMNSNLKDPYSVQEFAASAPRQGGVWTGTLYQGLVPAWYSCVQYNAKNGFGAYVGRKQFVYFIRENEVVGYFERAADNGFHKHACW